MMARHRFLRVILFVVCLGSRCLAQTPTLVQHISSGRDNTTGYTNPTFRFFLPNPTLPGNCLILRFEHDSALTTSSITTDKGDTFSAGPSLSNGGHALESYYVAASTGSQIISVVTAGSLGSDIDEVSGDVSEFYNTSCVADASGSSPSRSITLNPTTANDLIWQSGTDTSTLTPAITSMTVGPGYTMLHGNTSQGTFAQYQASASIGTQTVSFETSDNDAWQSVAIAFTSAPTGTAPPTNGIRVVNMYGEIFGDSTHTMYVPCSGNLLIGMWSSPAVTISGINSSPSGMWSSGASVNDPVGLISQIFYGQGMTCNSTLTMTPAYSDVGSGGLNFLVMLDVTGANASAHDVDVTNSGDQTFGSTLTTDTVTPTTASGLIVDATAWWGCTAISASPGLFAGIATNSGNSNVCPPTNTTSSTLNEDNGLALYYNPTTAPVTFIYTDTGSVQNWASVASAFKSGSRVVPNSGPTGGGTSVTITGTNFASGATVTFGDAAAANVVVVDSTTITATTPAGMAGAVTVTVTVDGQSENLTNGFTYVAQPTVSSVSPNSGSTGGGTAVTITGANFVSGAAVTFGETVATNVVVVDDTTITATTPPGIAGAVMVTVTVDGQSGSLTNGYTYVVAPAVSTVSPNNGPQAGGTAITITGTDFASGATVTFGSTAATNVVVVSSTTITATTPAGATGAVTVTVTVNGQSGSLTNGFTYVVTPTVSSVSPNSGPVAGGTAVTITGTNFASGATVTFGGAAATNVAVVNSTMITATTPAGNTGAVTVAVTLNGQSGVLTNGFTYTGTVAISFSQVASSTPQSPTQTVTVAYPRAQTMGDLNVVVVGWNDTTSTVQSVMDSVGNVYHLAIGPTTGTKLRQSIYYAANIAGGSNTVTVTFSQAAAYPDIRILEYRGVTTLDVTAGSNGSSTSASSGAATTTSPNELIFGANTVATLTKTAGSGFTSRIITVPDGNIAEDKVVTSSGNNSATATLTASGPWVMQMATFSAVSGPAPTVTSVSPSSGTTAGGTSVTITGTNFVSGATVTFGSAAATNVVVVNSTSITATSPAGSSGAVTLTVTNPGALSGSLANGFTYVVPPAVSSLSPNNGPAAGGTAVTITGTNFASGATVKFGSTAATNVVVVNGTTITATTPAGTSGAVTVTVTNGNGLSGSLASGFTYVVPPTVSSVSPNNGSTSGGTAVTITGMSFTSGATVMFGSAAATNVVVGSSTSITATTPAGSVGAVTVTVTVGGQSGSLANGFTYTAVVTVATPSFTPGAGTYGSAQSVSITSATSGATICYTTNGSAPAANIPGTCSTGTALANGGSVMVSTSETLKAIGTENGFTNSAVGGASYIISTCAQNLAIGSFTLCGESYNDVSTGRMYKSITAHLPTTALLLGLRGVSLPHAILQSPA